MIEYGVMEVRGFGDETFIGPRTFCSPQEAKGYRQLLLERQEELRLRAMIEKRLNYPHGTNENMIYWVNPLYHSPFYKETTYHVVRREVTPWEPCDV